MKFKVGQVWEDGYGDKFTITSVRGAKFFDGVPQPIVATMFGCEYSFTVEGWFGDTEESLKLNNLTRLISEPAEEAEPEVSGETDTPPVTLELMQEFTYEDTELCALARGLQDRGAKFEGSVTSGVWSIQRFDFKSSMCTYRMVSIPPADEPELQDQIAGPVAAAPTKRRLKLMIVGHGRHGKDTVAQILADELGLTFCSSSYFCAKAFIYDALKNVFGYRSIAECYDDRNKNQRMRDLWHTLICAYNKDDPARLSREILSEYDIYVGIRSDEEFAVAEEEGLFDLSIWVDASRRLDPEGESSFEIDRSDCDIIIENDYSEEDLIRRVTRLASVLDVS